MNSQWFTIPLGDPGVQSDARYPDPAESVRRLNSLLRAEISASETYRMAIDKLMLDGRDPSNVALLREIQRDHVRAAQIFRARIAEMGEQPESTSGAWGTWAKIAMGTAQIFGDSAALHALMDGEEHGLKEMQSSLDDLDADSAELIEKAMIPAQQRHIQRVQSLISLINS